MSRFGYAFFTTLSAALFVVLFILVAVADPRPRLIWNASASAPIGLYSLRPLKHPSVGALVAVTPPAPLADWLAIRGYLPRDVPLLKTIAAVPGQRVCRVGEAISIDARLVGEARRRDSQGRALPVWCGCRTIGPDELFFMNNAVPDSLDSRYFGPLPRTTLLGQAIPLWTDPPRRPAPSTTF
jgi:conjugative transfer signal peptidase TraF